MLVTVIELVWTVIAGAGILAQTWLLHDALATAAAARSDPHGNDRRGRMIRGHIRASAAFLFVHVTFFFAGVRAVMTPNAPLAFGRLITIVLFIAAAAALVWIGYADRADRLWIRSHPDSPRRRLTD